MSAPARACTDCTHARSAPAASARGRMVSLLPSSAFRMSVVCFAGIPHGVPSGIASPRLKRAAMSIERSDLPTLGSPSSSTSFARGIYGSQSQRTGRESTWESGSAVRVLIINAAPCYWANNIHGCPSILGSVCVDCNLGRTGKMPIGTRISRTRRTKESDCHPSKADRDNLTRKAAKTPRKPHLSDCQRCV